MCDCKSEVAFEMMKAEPCLIDETAIECFFDKRHEGGRPEHGNGRLPSLPDVAARLRLNRLKRLAKKTNDFVTVELTPQDEHRQSLTHARANILVGRPIEDDVVKRSGIAIEHSRYDPVTGGDGCVAQNIVYVRRTKQTGERAICGFLAPTTEKVKDEEKLIPARWALGRCSEKCLNFP